MIKIFLETGYSIFIIELCKHLDLVKISWIALNLMNFENGIPPVSYVDRQSSERGELELLRRKLWFLMSNLYTCCCNHMPFQENCLVLCRSINVIRSKSLVLHPFNLFPFQFFYTIASCSTYIFVNLMMFHCNWYGVLELYYPVCYIPITAVYFPI